MIAIKTQTDFFNHRNENPEKSPRPLKTHAKNAIIILLGVGKHTPPAEGVRHADDIFSEKTF